jgi:hypothetical protein
MRRIAPAGTAYLPVHCTVYSVLPTPSPTRCRTNVTAMRRIAPAGTAYLPVHCTVYRHPSSLVYQIPHKCHRILNTYQCTDIHAHSPTKCRTSVTAMHRIAPAGTAYLLVPGAAQVSQNCPRRYRTAYLPVQSTDVPAPSPTRCRKQCHGNAQNCHSRYCLPTCTVYRHTYSLTYQMPQTLSRQCAEFPQQVMHTYLYSVQTYLLPHLPDAANSVTAMSKIAVAGTAYLLVPSKDIPAPSPSRNRKQCHNNVRNCPSS